MLSFGNDRMRVSLLPEFGGRVTGLVDLRTGRDWIAARPPAGSASDDAVFDANAATGWDECFPTVSPCVHEGRRLRCHGALWGRPWAVVDHGRHHAELAIAVDGWRFARRLTARGDTLACEYAVTNEADAEQRFLWAMHLVLAARPGDRIELPPVTCRWTYRTGGTRPGTHAWPDGADFPLDEIQAADLAFAAKLHVDDRPEGAIIGDGEGALRIAGSRPQATALGLWFSYGGWPAEGGINQVAIEPASAPADDLASAVAMGRAVSVGAGETLAFAARLQLLPPLARMGA